MRLQKLKDTILPPEGTEVDDAKNEEAFAELIQFLDDKSLSLVMRDGVNNGKRDLDILTDHYAGKGKPMNNFSLHRTDIISKEIV